MANYVSRSIIIPFRMVFIMWAVFLIEYFYHINLSYFGVIPRTPMGLIGVIAMPLLHGSVAHIISNTFPLLFLGTTLFFFYDKIASKVFFFCYVLTGLLVWIFARPSIHIGASGLVYGIASFLIFFGVFRKDVKSALISVVVIFLYGGLVYGVLPILPGVSWESHLLGGIVGFFLALNYSSLKNV